MAFICQIDGCGKHFSCKKTLKEHKRTHTGERPYVCAKCDTTFAQYSSLQKHQRVHDKKRPYHCSYEGCDQSFSQISNLIRHERIHTGEKPYRCEDCGKEFASGSNLKQHKQVHEEESFRSQYTCFVSQCKKSYLYLSSLKKHIQVSHPVEYEMQVATNHIDLNDFKEMVSNKVPEDRNTINKKKLHKYKEKIKNKSGSLPAFEVVGKRAQSSANLAELDSKIASDHLETEEKEQIPERTPSLGSLLTGITHLDLNQSKNQDFKDFAQLQVNPELKGIFQNTAPQTGSSTSLSMRSPIPSQKTSFMALPLKSSTKLNEIGVLPTLLGCQQVVTQSNMFAGLTPTGKEIQAQSPFSDVLYPQEGQDWESFMQQCKMIKGLVSALMSSTDQQRLLKNNPIFSQVLADQQITQQLPPKLEVNFSDALFKSTSLSDFKGRDTRTLSEVQRTFELKSHTIKDLRKNRPEKSCSSVEIGTHDHHNQLPELQQDLSQKYYGRVIGFGKGSCISGNVKQSEKTNTTNIEYEDEEEKKKVQLLYRCLSSKNYYNHNASVSKKVPMSQEIAKLSTTQKRQKIEKTLKKLECIKTGFQYQTQSQDFMGQSIAQMSTANCKNTCSSQKICPELLPTQCDDFFAGKCSCVNFCHKLAKFNQHFNNQVRFTEIEDICQLDSYQFVENQEISTQF